MPKEKERIIAIDSSADWDRKLKYMEKQSGWEVFKSIYWGIYIFIVGFMALLMNAGVLTFSGIIGWAITILSVFVIIYGFVLSLHLKFLKKHG